MPQMHPLMWAALFAFSLTCLIFITAIMFFSFEKSNFIETPSKTPQTKNLTWKW